MTRLRFLFTLCTLALVGCATPPITDTPASTTTATYPALATPIPTRLMDVSIIASATPTRDLVYVFPIFPVEDATYQCGHHDYPAIDIAAPEGSQFLAVTSGEIDFVQHTDEWSGLTDDPVTRGGLSIALVGDDGVRYYGSHLSRIEEGIRAGVRVKAGQVIGATGTSGNAVGTIPHLHFGISHPTRPSDWIVRRGEVDPCEYITAWAAGEPLTPDLTQRVTHYPTAAPGMHHDE